MSSNALRLIQSKTKLPPLPTISQLLRLYNLQARQQLSQNFILDKNVADAVARHISKDLSKSIVVEVGPGPGSITRSILERAVGNLVVVEKDERVLPILKQLASASEGRMKIVMGDIMTVNHNSLLAVANIPESHVATTPLHIFGNLPFAISTALLIQWIHLLSTSSGLFSHFPKTDLTLVFQKEVADRIVAAHSSSERSRLSVMSQTYFDVNIVYSLNASVFVPKPKVDAAMVKFTPRFPPPQISSFALEEVLRCHFIHRRKTLRNTTYPMLTDRGATAVEVADMLRTLNLDDGLRPDALSNRQWSDMTQHAVTNGWVSTAPSQKFKKLLATWEANQSFTEQKEIEDKL